MAVIVEDYMRPHLLASFGLALALLVPPALPTPVEAASISITIGTSLNRGRGITCREGERLLRNRGFRDIRRIDCRARFFIYRARRSGNRFEIALNSHNGRVVDVRRIRR
jgi:hypothetical protein